MGPGLGLLGSCGSPALALQWGMFILKVWIDIFLLSPKAFTNPSLKQQLDCISEEEGVGERAEKKQREPLHPPPPPSPNPLMIWDGV